MIERQEPDSRSATIPPQRGVTFLIADVAALTGVPAPQLRSWEQAGLLHPLRSPNATRLYGIEDVARVRLIKRSLDNPGRRGSLRRLLAQLTAGTLRPAQEDYAGLTSPATMSDTLYWQAVVDAMAELVVVSDRNGRMTSMNPALRTLLSLPTDEPSVGGVEATDSPQPARTPAGVPLPAILEALPLRWAALTGTQHRDVPLVLRESEGVEQRTSWTVTPLYDPDGTLAGAVGVGRVLIPDLATSSEDWLAMAVHDLRTPVTTIRGRLELALRTMSVLFSGSMPPWAEQEKTDQLARHLATAELSTNDLIRLMDTLLDTSAAAAGTLIQQLEPGGVALEHVALQAVEHAQQRTSRHQITLKAPAVPSLVAGDSVRLRQVFDNLLANAMKFAPDGGPITIHMETLDTLPGQSPDLPSWMQGDSSDARGEKAAGQQRSTPQWVLARVADVGLGIPALAVPHVFDRYWRAGGATAHIRGTGLGLYACRSIVAAHGGHMWIERSVPAEDGESAGQWHGTVMALLLPLASPQVLGAVDSNGAAAVPGATVG